MKKLFVYYNAWGEHWLLGTLADNGDELLFEYSPEALRQELEMSPLDRLAFIGKYTSRLQYRKNGVCS